MTQAIKYGTRIVPADGSSFPVPPPPSVVGTDVSLLSSGAFRLVISGAPVYRFDIMTGDGMWAGETTLIAEPDTKNVYLVGHVGGDFSEQITSVEAISGVIALLQPLARQNGMTEMLITCRVGNQFVRDVCRNLGAKQLDAILDPQGIFMGQRMIARYLIDL